MAALLLATAMIATGAGPAAANPLTAMMPALGLPAAAPFAASSSAIGHATALPVVRWSLVTAGGSHTCAYLASAKQVRCWGLDREGQASPPPPSVLGTVKALAAGARHTCAVSTIGKLECWGANEFGQAEDPDVGPVASLSAGAYHTCIVSSAGAPYCWGDDTYGQSSVPEALERVKSISAGGYHTCAVTTVNRVVCWGALDDTEEEVSNRDKGQTDVPSNLGTVLQVSAGGFHTCALKTNREIACWGYDYSGQAEPTELNDLYSPFKQVSSGLYHTCALSTDGGVLCFGSDDQGQVTPPELFGVGALVATAAGHSCAQSTAGELACWGSDSEGQSSAPLVEFLEVTKTGYGSGRVSESNSDEYEREFGINCGSRCLSAHDLDSVVTLVPQPDRGSRFVGWSGACRGWGACRVTMTSSKSAVANFASNRPCIVPRTAGATQAAATTAIARAGCALGTVSKIRSRVRAGLVVASTPSAGTYRPLKSKVALVVSRGSR